MNKIKEKTLITIFFASLVFFLLVNSLVPKGDYLYYENRVIEGKADLNKKTLFNGEYFRRLEEYLVDSFKGRTSLLSLATEINLNVLKRPIVNDLHVDNKRILEVWEDDGEDYPGEEISEMAKAYGDLSSKLDKKGAHFIYLAMPGHASIFEDKYPDYMYNKGQEWRRIEEDFLGQLDKNKVSTIRARDFLKKNPDKFYSKTDHHFNFYGAVETYKNIIKKINMDLKMDLSSDGLELIELDKGLKGSYSRKLFNLDKFIDPVVIYEDKLEYTRKDNGQEVEAKVFHLENFEDKDYIGYDLYMGGDIGFTEIDTNRKELPDIMIYGDSFTNPLESLLVRNANKLISIDYRHYDEKTIGQLVDEYRPDIVLCVRHTTMFINKENNGILE